MSISILKAGLLTTIQDKGRYGYQKYGVVVSGAMDSYAMRLSNIIVGNDENEAVFEITLIGPELKIKRGNLISITGADLSPTINGVKVPMGRPVYLNEDCILKFGACIYGCRAYLSIAGGFDIPLVMESKSTYIRGEIGGKDGRALKNGDEVKISEKNELSEKIISKLFNIKSKKAFSYPKWYIKEAIFKNLEVNEIRVLEDRQFKDVSRESVEEFFSSEFIVDSKSDRMGYRLNGPEIKFKDNIEMISGEVSFGTIQISPDGNPIILLADRATAGGYPKIAHVIYYDFQKLVQVKPSEKIRFKNITFEEAEELYLERERYIEDLKKSIKLISI
ncbi:5-oxoprolinase subunit C family protein [Clostridium butyricum]